MFLPIPLILPLLKMSGNSTTDNGGSPGMFQSANVQSACSNMSDISTGVSVTKYHVGTQTDITGIADNGSGNGDAADYDDDLSPIEMIPCKLFNCFKTYLRLFPGDIGQMYALFHVCVVLAAVSNLFM